MSINIENSKSGCQPEYSRDLSFKYMNPNMKDDHPLYGETTVFTITKWDSGKISITEKWDRLDSNFCISAKQFMDIYMEASPEDLVEELPIDIMNDIKVLLAIEEFKR